MPYLASTRSSPLAQWQTDHVIELLGNVSQRTNTVEKLFVDTLGDRTQSVGTPLHQLGGQGVFVKEVQAAVLDGRASFAVHSAKDLPSVTPEGLTIAAIPKRGDVRDVLIGSTLHGLKEGALIGTGSVRRRAQLSAIRPDLRFAEIRGNVGTRIEKLSQFDAIVLAFVPLLRLGLLESIVSEHMIEVFDVNTMLPMVSQGAIAVECRADDHETIAMLNAINDPESGVSVTTERAFLGFFGAGCDFPIACLATVNTDGTIFADGLVAAHNGSKIVRAQLTGTDPLVLGRELAELIASQGGSELLSVQSAQ
jgi:hydroxymethylbilane synthase